MRRLVLPTSASALFYTKVFFGYLSYAKLLVCCADSLFGLDVRRDWCVVLSSLQVPPHFFTQKSSLATSAMHAFLCHETNFFCVSTTSGLLHDVFQTVSVHPIPIEICYGLLRYTKRCDDFFFGDFGHVLGLTGRRLSLRLDPTGREFPSPLVTVFDVPVARMRASAIRKRQSACVLC